MKSSLFQIAAFLSAGVFAFPAQLFKSDISADTLAEITVLASRIARDAETHQKTGNIKRGFDANAQHVSTTGKHAYMAPGANDLRGPCPGLNTLANHGYISRSGVSSVVELTTASNEVFGMGLDLAAFLSVYSGVMAGDITSVSIGGKPANGGGLLGGLGSSLGLLGTPQGLSKSHNRFEADASPTRQDLHLTGDPVSVSVPLFEQLIAMPQGPNGYDLTVMHPFRGARFNNSVATNGYYWAGPFTHYAVNTATYLFTYHLFSNFSAEHPDGFLDEETLKSFEGITGSRGSYEWKWGRERIPDNWHRRPIGDDYGLVAFALDAVGALKALPYMAVVGGNTGKPNTFTGVNIADLTGGVFSAETLLEGNNMMCFAFRAASIAAPDILSGLLGNALLAVQKLTDALNPLLNTLGCPQLSKYETSLLSGYPGAGSGL